MVALTPTEMLDIPKFFEGISEDTPIQPVMVPAEDDDRGGFHLILRGENINVMVYDRGRPAWFGDFRDAKFLLIHGFVREVITEGATVILRGYF